MVQTPAAAGTLIDDLTRHIGADQVLRRAVDRHARAHDASHYLIVPEVAVVAEDAAAVAEVLRVAGAHGCPVTFRSGGTSLSGQSCGPGILLDTRRAFRDIEVLDDGARVRVQPGATLRAVNARLARYRRAQGPDPASELACTIGGVIANNSSGMAAGTEFNTTRTLESMTVVLASGTVVDTGRSDALSRLRAAEPALVSTLEALRDRIRASPESTEEIRWRFGMKNTMGYSLDAFCTADSPAQLLSRLIIGSEGTLGFVAEAVYRTVPVQARASTGLLVFDSVDHAAEAIPDLVATGAKALELMDSTSLRVAQRGPRPPASISALDVEQHAAILVEYRGDDDADLDRCLSDADSTLTALRTSQPVEFTQDPAARAALWGVRKNLYATVAGARPAGTTALLEDVVVPVEQLADTCRELAELLAHHDYADPVIFGHAKDGNLHFMITEDTEDPADLARLESFTEDLVELILRQGGNLKAEHGTGRAMAPFLGRQYSAPLVQVMYEVKEAFDPAGILNPGVIIADDPRAHLLELKPVDRVDAEVDNCVECGYCEPVCPSRDLTLTPRQRIVVRRARERAAAQGDDALVAELDEQQEYESIATCAADGMCATACPVGIDTGALVKRLRQESRHGLGQQAWRSAAKHWGTATAAARRGLDVAAKAPDGAIMAPNHAARSLLGADTVPQWTADLPRGGTARSRVHVRAEERAEGQRAHSTASSPSSLAPSLASSSSRPGRPPSEEPRPGPAPSAIFLPSCQGAMFAPAEGSSGVQAAVESLCRAAGMTLVMPPGVDGLCCGTPWSSKGYSRGHEVMAERVLDAVHAVRAEHEPELAASLPVVVDAASCTEGVAGIMHQAREAGDHRASTVMDAVEFTVKHVVPQLMIDAERRVESLTLHPTCSSFKAGLNDDLRSLAGAAAKTVHIPQDWNCCGFAGDRGMLHPELTASATAAEAREVQEIGAQEHASCNRACEIALSRATGRPYRHVLETLADVVARADK